MSTRHKKCTKCGEVKLTDGFSKHRGRKDGLQSSCKGCERRYRKENREALAEYRRRYREGNREAVNEYERRYREENWEARAEYQRLYYKENREANDERNRRYDKESQEITSEVATRNRMPWAEAEDKFLLSTDMTYLEAAVELGRTANSVRQRKHNLRKNLQNI